MAQSTREYSLFKKHNSNRPLLEKNVVEIMRSVIAKNMLETKPILVTSDFRVIDGQHRLEAAKRLGVDIYFDVLKNADSADIFLLQKQMSWSLENYYTFYVAEEFPEYLALKKFIDKTGLPFSRGLQLLVGRNGAKDGRSFKAGKFKMPINAVVDESFSKLEKIKDVIDFIDEKLLGKKIFLKSGAFLLALSEFYNIAAVNHAIFMNKLAIRLDLIRPCTRAMDFVSIFKSIYNWKNRNHRIVEDIEGEEKEEQPVLLNLAQPL